ncbi:protein PapJ [Escherichia coli]|uniref:Protein PapJ n=1 Tax=Escherichia coli TaxID=562 RepID=A0A484YV90_ECOLX|nr:protein PapJ [Escherichia coli]
MVVNKTTAVLYLNCTVAEWFHPYFLRAEERGIYDDVFTADELHHYRINERGGRTGSLAVSGALLSSPLHAGE